MAWTVSGSLMGPTGPEGPTGPTGPQGPAGTGISFTGSVATYSDLPNNLTTANAGQAYEVTADGKLYVWSGTAFPANGQGSQFVGPTGPTGPANTLTVGTVSTGASGTSATVGITGDAPDQTINFTIPQGIQGPTGPTGPGGSTGPTGPRGSLWFTGSGAPGTVSGAVSGDLYLDTSSGYVYKLS